jgi:hypothetical protein
MAYLGAYPSARARALAGERARRRAFTLRLMSLVACKNTVVGGRRLTRPATVAVDLLANL